MMILLFRSRDLITHIRDIGQDPYDHGGYYALVSQNMQAFLKKKTVPTRARPT